YSAAEVVGQPVSILVPPERAGEVHAVLEHVRGGGRLENLETVRLRKDGTRIDVSLSISPMADATGRVTGSSVIARDITRRKRSERHLAAEHAVTGALAESANLRDAAAKVLKTDAAALGCDPGGLWGVDPALEVLRFGAVLH